MSIYRKFEREPTNDMHAKLPKRAENTVVPPAQHPQHPEHPQHPQHPTAAGSVEPMPQTIAWAAKLPHDVRPMSLIRQFPRIANFMAATWLDPDTLRPYLDDLFVDRRGSRRGFPPEVMAELFAIRAHFEDLHPSRDAKWDHSSHHR